MTAHTVTGNTNFRAAKHCTPVTPVNKQVPMPQTQSSNLKKKNLGNKWY